MDSASFAETPYNLNARTARKRILEAVTDPFGAIGDARPAAKRVAMLRRKHGHKT
jgi:hypothetical protein